jgi:hypothetical protein
MTAPVAVPATSAGSASSIRLHGTGGNRRSPR